MTKTLGVSLLALMLSSSAHAQQIGDVFYLALENHNFTQPSSAPAGTPEQLLGDPAASFLNSLVTPGNPNAAYTSYATNYQNVSPTLHPSEPNYVYQVSGTTGPLNDSDPYPNNIVTAPNLGQLLQQKYGAAGWKSYQEDVDLVPNSGTVNQPGANSLTSTVAPQSQWTVPTSSFSGTSASYTNPYNGSHQYNYAAKHNPFVFFPSTNGGSTTAPDTSPSNPETPYYAPLQQLQTDLNDNTVAKFNWITPDQYNDMHSSLNTNFTYNGVTYQAGTDQEAVALGDNFLSQIVPEIEASQAFQDNGVIVIWNDETEGDSTVGSTAGYSGTEIVISKLAVGNAYSVDTLYTHASDLATWQNVFGVSGPNGYLGGAGGATDLSALFQPGVIPTAIPETSTWAMMALGFAGLAGAAAFGCGSRARLALGA